MCRFPEFYMEMKWGVLIVFHMVMKPLIQKKLSFRETGKNTEKPNGKLKKITGAVRKEVLRFPLEQESFRYIARF
jgi:hypothetical protein